MSVLDAQMEKSITKSHTANILCKNVAYDGFNKSKALYGELIKFIALYEGEDETKGNKLQFELKTKPEIEPIPSYSVSGPTIISN